MRVTLEITGIGYADELFKIIRTDEADSKYNSNLVYRPADACIVQGDFPLFEQ